jgi:hypothetical protein
MAELWRNGNHAVTLTRALVLPNGKKKGTVTATFQLLGDVTGVLGTAGSAAYSPPAGVVPELECTCFGGVLLYAHVRVYMRACACTLACILLHSCTAAKVSPLLKCVCVCVCVCAQRRSEDYTSPAAVLRADSSQQAQRHARRRCGRMWARRRLCTQSFLRTLCMASLCCKQNQTLLSACLAVVCVRALQLWAGLRSSTTVACLLRRGTCAQTVAGRGSIRHSATSPKYQWTCSWVHVKWIRRD